ncbi:Pimeloyl-ACP methyl ester carboxylesterase [Methylobacterium sp. 174MFSha1.1]|uniref:alpha/beta fold hydrolase n=1 Tax=Methylobacterium sp. 174MFSha1.1 TaxID=1502749 RepID=UPI0008E41928|nr:alpha/beta hydrolase [Methylobacterium sp. 174MFSha1.1]SFU59392.1 Pimeloyl-ACP methyl ester carboxylesterase [Methylobacterium sp. 174MFSha1.1]
MDQTRRRLVTTLAALGAAALPPRMARAGAPARATTGDTSRTTDREAFVARSADGTALAGEAAGDPGAPEILFVHGLRQSRLSWDKQFADPALGAFRLVRFDLRGHGDSGKPDAPASYADPDLWAEDVAAVIAAARLRRPVLVGWSLGGYVAGAYLRKYDPAGIAGVNLVDAVTKLSPDLLTPLAGSFTTTATSPDLATRVAATADFLAACFHRPPSDRDFQRMLVVNGMTARAANEGFVRTPIPDLEPVFAAYDGPVLLTHGAHDRLVRPAMAERIRALKPGRRLSVFEESGHSPFYEEPERFGRELAAFVAAAGKA